MEYYNADTLNNIDVVNIRISERGAGKLAEQIDELENFLTSSHDSPIEECAGVKIVQAAKKNLIPYRPVVDTAGTEPWYRCRRCDGLLSSIHNSAVYNIKPNFCERCGGAVLWNDAAREEKG